MAPGFFSKLVKPSGNHSRNSSANSSPQSPTSSRHPSISMSSSQSSAKNSVEKANGNGRPPTIVVEAGYESSGSGPNVTVIPPSPSISGSSLPPPSPSPPSRELAPDDSKFEDARKRVQSLPAVSPSTPSPSAHLPDDGLPTPTPATTTFVHMPSHPTPSIMHSRSSDNLRADKDKSQQGSKSGSVRSNHPRSATVAEGTHLQTPKELRHTSSNKSLRSKLSIMLPSRDSPQSSQTSSRHDRSISAPYPPSPPAHLEGSTLVESPTGLTHEVPLPHPMSVSMTTTSFGSSLSVPDNSDAVSIKSTGSAASKKRRPWRRGSNQGTPIPPVPTSATSGPTLSSASGKSSSRKNTGLASALAASGLAMANPGMNLPQISPAPAETNATSARGRTSTEMARPRGGSMNYVGSDYSDRESFHSGHDDSVSEESDSDELDLDPEDIPVTGFAVASNKRNQDFHELFPTVPEGDYLIEDYGCALQREILIQGRLYISENHVCFHANIFGWITDLSIPMFEVISLEKRMTAFVIPNAIQLSTRTAKYTFTSFLARDTTYDVLYNVWRLARPEDSSMGSQRVSPRGSLDNDEGSSVAEGSPNGAPKKKIANKVTQCSCGKHYPEVAMEAVFPGAPEKIYNLMFTSGFMKDFMRENQKLLDIQISDWTPTEDPKLLARNMTYIKPLNGSIGPKQTRCELRDETVHCDFDEFVIMLTTTRTPEVPSGGAFSVKTRTCITWASSVSSKVLVTTQVEWSGRSYIKGIIEKSCISGQKTYHVQLEEAMRQYIHEHRAEFVPEGIDVAEVEETAQATTEQIPLTPTRLQSEDEVRKEREHERNQRSLQWAYDTFAGAFNVGKRSTEGALELIHDAWDQSSSTTMLWFVIVFLVISNFWTLSIMGSREEAGRRKEMRKTEEREKWVQGIVTALWEELLQTRGPAGVVGVVGGLGGIGQAPLARGDWKEEIGAINVQLDLVEQRISHIRESLEPLDSLS